MGKLLATFSLDGERHRVELAALRGGALVLDRAGEGPALVVAELDREEGQDQAFAVLGAGGYLERARAGEPGLCRALAEDDALARPARQRAA